MCVVGRLRLGMVFSFVIEFHSKPIHRMDPFIDIHESLSDGMIRGDPGSVFDGFASPGPERPSGSSWIQLVTRCHEPHMKQHIQSYLQRVSISIPMYTPCPYIPAPVRAQMFPADFGHLCERLCRAQGRGRSPKN